MVKKNYLIDIDGTVCDDIPNETPELFATAKVYPDALERLNKWHDEGHTITFFTARPKRYYMITTDWLIENGFKYDGLIMDKPRGGNYHWIDNLKVQATQYLGKFTELKKTNKLIETFDETL